MKKWEYKIHVQNIMSEDKVTLNSLGSEGWEMITTYLGMSGSMNYLFKRKKRRFRR